MEKLGQQLANVCPRQLLVFLQGNLGAGKTTLVRGFLHGLGYEGTVKSPTYTLVEPYSLKSHSIYHFDLYRINNPSELEEFGIRDYFENQAIKLLEWPERCLEVLPEPDLFISIDQPRHTQRQVTVSAKSPQGMEIVNKINKLSPDFAI